MSNVIDRPLALVILDGWGIAPAGPANAISKAHTPFYDQICRRYPQTSLAAAGESVGLSREIREMRRSAILVSVRGALL